MRSGRHGRAQSGLTLIELVMAAGLLTLIMIAVFSLLDGSLDLWRKSETRRNLGEQAGGVMELLARDLAALEPGERGDLLADWVRFDTDANGMVETGWPRLRMVRQASAAEVAALSAGSEIPPPIGPALLEVAWVVTPASGAQDARAEGVIWRGQRLLGRAGGESFFDPAFLGRDHRPAPGALEEVTGGLLWMGLLFATQTSIVHDGWKVGPELEHAATSWDAWSRQRPDLTLHVYNEAGAGMPRVEGRPLLPRRVRVELEFERPVDRKRRPRLALAAAASDAVLVLDDATRLSAEAGAHVQVGGEWMKIRDVSRDRVTVQRGRRGTEPLVHPAGAMVHWGPAVVREVPVRLYREDWNL